MADKIDLAVGCDSFRLANPPPWTACLNYASLEVSFKTCFQTIFRKKLDIRLPNSLPILNTFPDIS